MSVTAKEKSDLVLEEGEPGWGDRGLDSPEEDGPPPLSLDPLLLDDTGPLDPLLEVYVVAKLDPPVDSGPFILDEEELEHFFSLLLLSLFEDDVSPFNLLFVGGRLLVAELTTELAISDLTISCRPDFVRFIFIFRPLSISSLLTLAEF